MIHVYLINDADMPDSLSHYLISSRLDRVFLMAREFQIRVGKELIPRHIV